MAGAIAKTTDQGWLSRLRLLFRALFDRRVGWTARLVVVAVIVYVLSPLDLVPDTVPVAGWIDDMIVVPLGLWLVRRLIPDDVLDDLAGDPGEGD